MTQAKTLVSLMVLVALSCGQKKDTPKAGDPSPPTPPTTPTPAASTPSPQPTPDNANLITPEGIGAFKLGTGYKEVEAMKGSYVVMDDFIEFQEIGIQVSFTKEKTACKIGLNKAGPRTKEGLGFGNTYAEYEKVYGPGKATGVGFERNFEKFPELHIAPEAEPTPETVIDLLAIGQCPPKE